VTVFRNIFSSKSLNFYRTTRCHVPVDHTLCRIHTFLTFSVWHTRIMSCSVACIIPKALCDIPGHSSFLFSMRDCLHLLNSQPRIKFFADCLGLYSGYSQLSPHMETASFTGTRRRTMPRWQGSDITLHDSEFWDKYNSQRLEKYSTELFLLRELQCVTARPYWKIVDQNLK
jgi:hypothetical protein